MGVEILKTKILEKSEVIGLKSTSENSQMWSSSSNTQRFSLFQLNYITTIDRSFKSWDEMKLYLYNSPLFLERKKCVIITGANIPIRESNTSRVGEMILCFSTDPNSKCLLQKCNRVAIASLTEPSTKKLVCSFKYLKFDD